MKLNIGEEIGRGHFGRVHIGSDAIRDTLAIKIMVRDAEEPDDKWNSRRDGLIAEGASLQRATHENIVQVHYVEGSEDGNAVHLAMEFCDGGSLESPYKSGPIPPSQVRKYGKDASLGLASLHDRGMIHRDIKPGNILLDRRGSAKISDFGLVTDDIVEGYAQAAGYIDHLPPEYYETQLCSIKSDIWALGVTLYRLLHGHDWYVTHDRPRNIVPNGGFSTSLRWLPHINNGWRRAIRRMLSDNHNDRPNDMRVVSEILGQITVADSWNCKRTESGFCWSKCIKQRIKIVKITQHSERSYSWEACNKPINGVGRTRKLGGSSKIGYMQAERELRAFFNAN